MRWLLRLPVFALALSTGHPAFHAVPVETHHARVELLSQSNAVAPNQKIWLGVHFSLEKDWHIYWRNPGDSGQPPVFRWQLPPGFVAGGVEWPRPQKLKHSSVADYGYEDAAMLLVPVLVPGNLQSGSKAEITLHAKWLICREICLPDQALLHLSLPVSSAPAEDKNNARLFADARKLLPNPWPHSWRASAASEKDTHVLSIETGKPVQAAEFFPLEPNQIENSAPQGLEPTPRGAMLTLKKSDQLLKPIPFLKGVLALGGDSYQVRARVTKR
jgi:DsbC/DsbD-like thiol-disulfide interchange protein